VIICTSCKIRWVGCICIYGDNKLCTKEDICSKGVVDAFETIAQEGKIDFEWVSKEIDGEANQFFKVEEKIKMAKQPIIVAFKCL
jgi:hypothetical protein